MKSFRVGSALTYVVLIVLLIQSFESMAAIIYWDEINDYPSRWDGSTLTLQSGDKLYYAERVGNPGSYVYLDPGRDKSPDPSLFISKLIVEDGAKFYCNAQGRYDEDESRTLNVGTILVRDSGSAFECGKDGNKFTGTFTINFKEELNCDVGQGHCQGFIVSNSASLSLFGDFDINDSAWTRIVGDVDVGTGLAGDPITVEDATGWIAKAGAVSGDTIVIAPSTLGTASISELNSNGFGGYIQTFEVMDVNGNQITLDSSTSQWISGGVFNISYAAPEDEIKYDYPDPLDSHHFNTILDGLTDQAGASLKARVIGKKGSNLILDERTEVANITRNIRILGDQSQIANKNGVHMKFTSDSNIQIDGIEISQAGRQGAMGQYPVHWHEMASRSSDFIRNSSIHDSYNRCIVVHKTSDLRIQNNICVDIYGHAIFLEEGNEINNQIVDNLVIGVRPVSDAVALLQSDREEEYSHFKFSSSAAFWISNPDNILIGNSASAAGTGYWYALKNDDISPVDPIPPGTVPVIPNEAEMGIFSGNIAHSVNIGYSMDGGPVGALNGNPLNASDRLLEENAGYYSGIVGQILVDDFISYKASGLAMWLASGDAGFVQNSVFADSGTNVAIVFSDDLVNSVVVGASPGLMNSPEGCDNLESPFSISPSGYVLYDGPSRIEGVHFDMYGDYDSSNCPIRPVSISSSAALRSPAHTFEGVTFENIPSDGVLADYEHYQHNPNKSNNAFGVYSTAIDETHVSLSADPDKNTFYNLANAPAGCFNDAALDNAMVCPGKFGLFFANRDTGIRMPIKFTRDVSSAGYDSYPAIYRKSDVPAPAPLTVPGAFVELYGETCSEGSCQPCTSGDCEVVVRWWKYQNKTSPVAHGYDKNDLVAFDDHMSDVPSSLDRMYPENAFFYIDPIDDEDDNKFKISRSVISDAPDYVTVDYSELYPDPENETPLVLVLDAWYSDQFSFSLDALASNDTDIDDLESYTVTFLNPYPFNASPIDLKAQFLFMTDDEQWSPWLTYHIPNIGATDLNCIITPLSESDTMVKEEGSIEVDTLAIYAGESVIRFRAQAVKSMNQFVETRGLNGAHFDSNYRNFYFNEVHLTCGSNL